MKRIIAILLILSVVLLNAPLIMAANEPSGAEHYEKLFGLGVISENAFKGEKVTREEFIIAVIDMCRLKNGSFADIPFIDVTKKSATAYATGAALQLGFIGASEAFRPKDFITVSEATKILLSALGYDDLSLAKGGYPFGYMTVAGQLGLSVSAGHNEPLLKNDAYFMLSEAVECEIMQVVGVGNGYFTYETRKGETFLKEYYSITKIKGIVEADAFSDLKAQDSMIGADRMIINGRVYRMPTYQDFLGYYCEAYYSDENDSEEIVYIRPIKNNVLIIDCKNISSAAGNKIIYEVDDKERTAYLNAYASVILNGKLASYQESVFMPEEGNVTLIDNDLDGSYDVAKVCAYERLQVVGITENCIYSSSGEVIELNENSGDYKVEITKNGTVSAFSEIKIDDVVLAACSSGNGYNLKKILVSDKNEDGKITEKNDETVKIGSKTYNTAKSIHSKLEIGKYGIYYIDALGKIAFADLEPTIVYGYLKAMKHEKFEEPALRIFTENNRWVSLPLREKLLFNGTPNVPAENVKASLENSDIQQLITYRVNSDAKIVELNTASYFVRKSDAEKQAIAKNTFRVFSQAKQSKKYRSNSRSFEYNISIGSETVIIKIPTNDMSNEDGYKVISADSFFGDQTYSFNAYDVDNLGIASVIVVDAADDPLNTNSTIQNLFVVTGTGKMLSSDGSAKDSLIGYRSGIPLSFCIGDKNVLKLADGDVGIGDIIQIGINGYGEINNVNRIHKNGVTYFRQNNVWSAYTMLNGLVMDVNVAERRIAIEYEAGSEGVFVLPETVYIYDSGRNLVEKASLQDIVKDDLVVVSMRYQCIRELYIIR